MGYVFKIVAQPHSHQAFRYQLAGRLTLPANNPPSFSSSSSSSWISAGVSTGIDMSADGQSLLACWAHRPGPTSAVLSHSLAAGAQLSGLSGGAAVFTWKGFGQSLHALQLPVPQGENTAIGIGIGATVRTLSCGGITDRSANPTHLSDGTSVCGTDAMLPPVGSGHSCLAPTPLGPVVLCIAGHCTAGDTPTTKQTKCLQTVRTSYAVCLCIKLLQAPRALASPASCQQMAALLWCLMPHEGP
jgi:hypothetical protein